MEKGGLVMESFFRMIIPPSAERTGFKLFNKTYYELNDEAIKQFRSVGIKVMVLIKEM